MKLRQITIPVLTILTLAANFLIDIWQPGGNTTAGVSDKYFTSVTPYDTTFLVWPVIYLGLFAFSVYQAMPAQKNKKFIDATFIWYLIASVANIIWLILWNMELIIATPVLIIALLASLIAIYVSLSKNKPSPDKFSWPDRLFVYLPFSIYMGWISVSTIANIASTFVYFEVNELIVSGELWAAVLVIVAALIALGLLYFKQDIPYAATILWGLFGIANNNVQSDPIQMAFLASATILFLFSAYSVFVWYRGMKDTNKQYF